MTIPTLPADEQPTQSRHPARASARTAVASTVPALALVWPLLENRYGLDVALLLALAVIAGNAIITRIMAVPAVEALLRTVAPALAAAPVQTPGTHRKAP